MAYEIDDAFVQQYNSNIALVAQQKQSRLERAVRREPISAEFEYFDRIGTTEAQPKSGRHADTPLMNTPHYRRKVASSPYHWADMVDGTDKLRMLADPTSPYVQNAVAAFNRTKDRIIIGAFDCTAYTGKEGNTPIALPSKQILGSNENGSGSDTPAGLTIDKLLVTREILLQNEAMAEGDMLYLACSARQLTNLLGTTEVKSADYNTVKALVKGEINTFAGFEFIRTELMPWANNTRQCFAWVKDGILLAAAKDITTRITERADKSYSTQIYVEMDMGATRMEEEKVVQIPCLETPRT